MFLKISCIGMMIMRALIFRRSRVEMLFPKSILFYLFFRIITMVFQNHSYESVKT